MEERAQTWRLLLLRTNGVGGTLISLLISILLVQLTTGCCYGLLCRKSFFFLSLHSIAPRPKITSASNSTFVFQHIVILLRRPYESSFSATKSSVSTLPYLHIPLIIDSLCWHFFFFMSLRSSSCEKDRKKYFFLTLRYGNSSIFFEEILNFDPTQNSDLHTHTTAAAAAAAAQ